jgi:hypothetical protein
LTNDDAERAADGTVENDDSTGNGNSTDDANGRVLLNMRRSQHINARIDFSNTHLLMGRILDDEDGETYVDFVGFQVPTTCANTRAGCDWTELGVGAKYSDGTLRWCCSPDAVTLGLCKEDNIGSLIVDEEKLPGKKRVIAIANTGFVADLKVSTPVVPEVSTGQYVLVMANCNDHGRDILVTGEAAGKSEHGYLPGDLYGFLFFFAALTIAYLVIVLWYWAFMHLNQESRIPIEHWILLTIVLGLLEMSFKTADVYVWNIHGYRIWFLSYMGIAMGVVKRVLSRSLIVMVSLGWGVTRDVLGRKYKWIFMLGIAYLAASSLCDLTLVIAVEDTNKLSNNAETELYDMYTVLTFVVALIDVIYAMWILDALAVTMEHLESMKQTRKLKRYYKLRCLFLFAVVFATAWAMFALANAVTNGILQEEDSWMLDGATELNYLIVLIGVALLWRPSPSSKEYVYALELSAVNADGEIEMQGQVPSALDDDDYDDGYTGKKVYHDE